MKMGYKVGHPKKTVTNVISTRLAPDPVINAVILTPISRVFSPQLPDYFRPFISGRWPTL